MSPIANTGQHNTIAPPGKGFFVFHVTLQWDVAGPFSVREDAFADAEKRKQETGVNSWMVQLKPLKRPKDKRDPVLMGVVIHLAGLLGETKKAPIEVLMNIIQVCGVAFAEATYKETMEVEAKGGMAVVNATRTAGRTQRTRGGIFFHLARQRMTPEQRDKIVRWKHERAGYTHWATQQEKAREAAGQAGDASQEPSVALDGQQAPDEALPGAMGETHQ